MIETYFDKDLVLPYPCCEYHRYSKLIGVVEQT